MEVTPNPAEIKEFNEHMEDQVMMEIRLDHGERERIVA
jgi:hypothetical protein